jgi:hypothetical protein
MRSQATRTQTGFTKRCHTLPSDFFCLKESEEAERQKLEQQLAKAGVVIAEDIPYEWPKKKGRT